MRGNDVVYVKMRYPEKKGMTEIKAYLNNEGRFICEGCYKA
nr:Fe3+ hydroxamate ABC transporter substrate-binding protein [Bacillus sp. es.034]